MRKFWCFSALFLSGAVALAQQPNNNPNQFFTGVNPRTIKNVTVDPSRAMQRNTLGHSMLPPTAQSKTGSRFGAGSFFPRVTLASWPPRLPTFSKVQTPPVPKTMTVPAGSVNLFKPATK